MIIIDLMVDMNSRIIGWQQAARIVGKSATTVRRQVESGTLPCEVLADGRHAFDREDLLRLAGGSDAATSASAGVEESEPSEPRSASGKLAAAAYRLFAAGLGPNEAVIELEQPPSTIKRLYEEYVGAKDGVVIPAAVWSAIQESLDRPGLSPERLLAAVQASLQRQDELEDELASFQFPCSICGEAVPAERTSWQAILQSGVLDGWAHGPCAAEK